MKPTLLRKLTTRDAALIVMGGIIGSGIFRNPSVVAQRLHTAPLIMLAWIAGGAFAILGALLFAELAARRPRDGGLYAYVRDAYHPVVAFSYGWTLLLVSQSGGMASAAIIFSSYLATIFGWDPNSDLIGRLVPIAVLAILTLINCLGVRAGTSTQNAFMVLKIAAIVGLIVAGLFSPHAVAAAAAERAATANGFGLFAIFMLAIVPVIFSYSGWQTASFMTAELKSPERTLPQGMIWGVLGVVGLYVAVNLVCLHVLGEGGLANTTTPASDIARLLLGPKGQIVMATIVAISTLGFLSNQMLVSPRVYFQMAQDGMFFKQLAWVHPKTFVPVTAIAVQGVVSALIACWKNYGQIVNYVTAIDEIFFGLAAIALIIFRIRDRRDGTDAQVGYRMLGYPYTTILFLVAAWAVVANLFLHSPSDSLIGLGILLIGVPIYYIFRAAHRRALRQPPGDTGSG
ncbi:MAG TPA: amino acid permease [Verrucomicrobiae bacterium]|jgi:APA family basic amino acid/polyamine antiporter|nr:amino acid permease [Verrucomicrobiae bacterium]